MSTDSTDGDNSDNDKRVNNTPTYPGNTDDIDDGSCVIIVTNRMLPNIRLQIRDTRRISRPRIAFLN